MSEGTQLVPTDKLNAGVPAKQDELLGKMVQSGDFLPRVQLFGSNSAAVKDEKIGQGRFGFVKGDDIVDLGKAVNVLPLSYRFKAMDISDRENIINVHDPDSEEFQRIKASSDEQDSGCMWGVEYLIWVPEVGEFATIFLNSKSSRREAKPLRGMLGKGTTIESRLIKTSKYSWHAPKVVACSTPFEPPEEEAMTKEIEKFNNPKDDSKEVVSDDESSGRER